MGSMLPDLRGAYGLSGAFGDMLLSCYYAGNLAAGFGSGILPLYLGRISSLGGVLMPLLAGLLAGRFGFAGGMGAILVTVGLLIVFSALNLGAKPRSAADKNNEC